MCAWFGTFNSSLRESVKILCSYFRVECQKCVSQRPSNMASFRALEHNQAKLSKFPGLHLQRSVDDVSSSYLLRFFCETQPKSGEAGWAKKVCTRGRRLKLAGEKKFLRESTGEVGGSGLVEKSFHARAQAEVEVGWFSTAVVG